MPASIPVFWDRVAPLALIRNATLFLLLLLGILSNSSAQESPRVYRSEDGGKSWMASAEGLPTSFMINMIVYKSNILAAAGDGTLYTSKDQGRSWSLLSKNLPKNAKALTAHGDVLFAASWGVGVWVSFDGGKHWQSRNFGLSNWEVSSFFSSGSYIFAGTQAGIFCSWNNGQTWMNVHPNTQVNGFTQLGSNLYAATGTGVLQSGDYGQSWTNILPNSGVRSVHANNFGVFALTYREGMRRSADHGKSWQTANIGLATDNSSVLSIGAAGHYLLAGTATGMLESINGGTAWLTKEKGLQRGVMQFLALDEQVLLAVVIDNNDGC